VEILPWKDGLVVAHWGLRRLDSSTTCKATAIALGMVENVSIDEEPEGDGSGNLITAKGRRSFRLARRELTEEELSGSGVTKMMLDEIDRLEADCFALRDVSARHSAADKKVGILEEKLRQRTAFDILTSGALATGSALTGFAPNMWSSNPLPTIFIAAIGIVLTVVGVTARMKEK